MAAMAIAREHGVPVLARGGGTSQCGQTVNRALVIDCSKHLRRILARRHRGRHRAGRARARAHPSQRRAEAARAVLPRRSLHAGALHHRRHGRQQFLRLEIHPLRADGRQCERDRRHARRRHAPPLRHRCRTISAPTCRPASPISCSACARSVPRRPTRSPRASHASSAASAATISTRSRPPRAPRGARESRAPARRLGRHARLLRRARAARWPRSSRARWSASASSPRFRAAMEAARHLVALDPEAVELVDRTMIDLGRAIPIYRATIDRMLIGEPDSLLLVEFHGHDDAPLLAKLAELDTLMADLGYPGAVVRATDAGVPGRHRRGARGRAQHHDVDEGRRETGLLHRGLRRRSRRPRRLHRAPQRRLRAPRHEGHLVRARLGRLPACPPGAQHEGPGRRRARMRAIAEECFALVREYKGSHSGEHGDGIARSEFNETMFGAAHRPRLRDGEGRVRSRPDCSTRTASSARRAWMTARCSATARTTLRRRASRPCSTGPTIPGALGGMLGAVEMCNNNGTCRKLRRRASCARATASRATRSISRAAAPTRCAWRSPASSAPMRWPRTTCWTR